MSSGICSVRPAELETELEIRTISRSAAHPSILSALAAFFAAKAASEKEELDPLRVRLRDACGAASNGALFHAAVSVFSICRRA
jgi:hypothetical protein